MPTVMVEEVRKLTQINFVLTTQSASVQHTTTMIKDGTQIGDPASHRGCYDFARGNDEQQQQTLQSFREAIGEEGLAFLRSLVL